MSDVFVPGVRSRFNTDQIIKDLMKLEQVPKDRVQNNIESLQLHRGYWQEVGKRINSVRESARFLYSFQNPFNERIAQSSDPSVITGSATREASEQSYNFSVKQTAQADRFLSQPLDEKMRVEAGKYNFTVGNEDISIDFRGGTLKDFVDTVNRRGRDKINLSLLAVQTGTRSLLIESKLTGIDNKLSFSGDSTDFVIQIGMMEYAKENNSGRTININENTIQKNTQNPQNITINEGVVKLSPLSSASLSMNVSVGANSPLILKLDTLTRVEESGIFSNTQPPPGPSVPSSSVTYGGITIANEPSAAPLPEWRAPVVPQRHDDMAVLSLNFTDGSSAKLPLITDSSSFVSRIYPLSDAAQGKTIASLNIENSNTHREISLGNVEILDPSASIDGLRPVNAVSSARNSIVSMEGIDITRTSNSIDDLIPGLTLNLRGTSDKPVAVEIRANVESVKDAIITFVGNYNRLMAEINILTSTRGSNTPDMPQPTVRGDDRLIDELTYLSRDEADEMRKRLGAFSSDITLTTLKNNLMRTVTAPYPTSLERDMALLAQVGISSNASRSSGYEVSRLRGYLEIDEKTLDAALENRIPAIRELFASDTNGDLLADTGVALNIDTLLRPFVETGGIITLKSNTIDSRINQDERRIATLDRQLASKEAELRLQYSRMESAYARMEQMSTSLDNFSQQNRPVNRQ